MKVTVTVERAAGGVKRPGMVRWRRHAERTFEGDESQVTRSASEFLEAQVEIGRAHV